MPNGAQFNLAPDKPDQRDFFYQPDQRLGPLPPAVDLRQADWGWPPVFDQGRLNSCTANAVGAVLAFDIRRQRRDDAFVPSRLFIYYNERYDEHAIGLPTYGDHGAPAFMRDCIKVVADNGFCSEAEWPYDESRFDTRPPEGAYAAALQHRSCDYFRIAQDLAMMKSCLAEGYPFVCGISVYPGFLAPQVRATGVVPMPFAEDADIGGHAIAVVGYDDARQLFIFRNSFGIAWGDRGHGCIPYAYLADPACAIDFWTVRKVVELAAATAETPGGAAPPRTSS